MNRTIDEEPEVLGDRIGALLSSTEPAAADILELQRQLLSRHADLALKPTVSAEEVVESFFRCCLVHHLQQRFELHPDSIPGCINSSHRATRRVCAARSEHHHQAIADDLWAAAWRRLQDEHPGVNVRVPDRHSPKRADLYVVARDKIVSFEFKYIGVQGLRDAAGCATQVRRHAATHALAFLVLYCGASIDVRDDAVARLKRLAGDARVLGVHGPTIPVVRTAAA
jgi:hypothetical protein